MITRISRTFYLRPEAIDIMFAWFWNLLFYDCEISIIDGTFQKKNFNTNPSFRHKQQRIPRLRKVLNHKKLYRTYYLWYSESRPRNLALSVLFVSQDPNLPPLRASSCQFRSSCNKPWKNTSLKGLQDQICLFLHWKTWFPNNTAFRIQQSF